MLLLIHITKNNFFIIIYIIQLFIRLYIINLFICPMIYTSISIYIIFMYINFLILFIYIFTKLFIYSFTYLDTYIYSFIWFILYLWCNNLCLYHITYLFISYYFSSNDLLINILFHHVFIRLTYITFYVIMLLIYASISLFIFHH